ncbi:MAG: AmmeMemoRadiSam system protein A, partial [Deltaproteobacteria bacterium]
MNTMTDVQRRRLLEIARDSITSALLRRRPAPLVEPWLGEPGACFVTLTIGGALRGCVGSLESRRALGEDVAANAISAAFDDTRFTPVTASEIGGLCIEISLLSPLERIAARTEAEALASIRPGTDGLVVRRGARRGTLLPQVWEDLPDAAEFLGHVKRKAGLPATLWDDQMELYRYTVSH